MLRALDAAEQLMRYFGDDALSLAEHHLTSHVSASESFFWLSVADALFEMNAEASAEQLDQVVRGTSLNPCR